MSRRSSLKSPTGKLPKSPHREVNAGSLVEERKQNAFPLFISPFVRVGDTVDGDQEELEPGELRVKAPEEVPWIDLLLEIAMTTAFSSLTDGTPIQQWDNALSYVCYFIFVWWIWVSQVAYNMRYRQADWAHRVYMFVQLAMFSALAAFTKSFDITNGLLSSPDATLTNSLLSQSGSDAGALSSFNFRDNRLPVLNAEGLSIVMAVSRLILLFQYCIVFFHARGLPRQSLIVHIIPLVFSVLCYMGAWGLIVGTTDDANGPSAAVSAIKLVLWYLPIALEITSHFVALNYAGWVKFPTEAISARSGTVFLIILGSGLDKTTSGFQNIVGNTGLGVNGIPLFMAAAVIFISYFTLFFGTPGSTRDLSSRRALSWFFGQFFFLASLIVAVQGVATSLAFTNLFNAMTKNQAAIAPVFAWVQAHPGTNITTSSYSSFNATSLLFDKLGISFPDIVTFLNEEIVYAATQNNTADILSATAALEEVTIMNYMLQTFDAVPDAGSLLSAQIAVFLNTDSGTGNITELNRANVYEILGGIVKDQGSSALWFYPASGATILALVLVSFIRGKPRDKWEWAVAGVRSLVGGGICALAFLDIGAEKPVFDENGQTTDSAIWRIVVGSHYWLLVILAIALGLLIMSEHCIAYAANHAYYTFTNVDFLNGPGRRKTMRKAKLAHQYKPTQNTDVEMEGDGDNVPLASFSYFDPKSPYSDQSSPNEGHKTPYSDPYDPYEDHGHAPTLLYSAGGH